MTAMPANPPATSPSRPKPTAVVVDDSLTTRRMLRALLEQEGFEVVAEGERGDQAIALYEQFRPAVITLDMIMPILDGTATAAMVLRRHPDALVIMCTSLTSRDQVLACRKLGVTHFILKPFTPATVTRVARSVLERLEASSKRAEVPDR